MSERVLRMSESHNCPYCGNIELTEAAYRFARGELSPSNDDENTALFCTKCQSELTRSDLSSN